MDEFVDTQSKMEPSVLDAAGVALVVVPHLRAGIASIDSKQPETVISKLFSFRYEYNS